MAEFNALVTALVRVTIKVSVEADNEDEALNLIQDGDWDDITDEQGFDLVEAEDVTFY